MERTYGKPRLGNPKDPLEDLVYVLLSNRTPPVRAVAVYEKLLEEFPAWADVVEAEEPKLVSVLKPAGFATKRASQIRRSLEKVRMDFGAYTLEPLRSESSNAALDYLTTLPGVSEKVAKCVMMYTLGFDVLPVDVHVHRVAQRLGWTDIDRPEKDRGRLEEVVAPSKRYVFHITCIAHGRELCRATEPRCSECPLTWRCEYYQEVHLSA